MTVVKKCLEEPYTVSYASGRLENVRIHDIEFLDSQELGLVVESMKGKENDLSIVCISVNMTFFLECFSFTVLFGYHYIS